MYAADPDLPVLGAQVLGLYLCVRLPLAYLRRDLPQEFLAEVYGSGRPPSHGSSVPAPFLIARAINDEVPTEWVTSGLLVVLSLTLIMVCIGYVSTGRMRTVSNEG